MQVELLPTLDEKTDVEGGRAHRLGGLGSQKSTRELVVEDRRDRKRRRADDRRRARRW
jgi:hypothetical protein